MAKNSTVKNPMKVITGEDTRWSFANVWEPKSINGGAPKYSVSLIIPKSDTKTVAKIKAAIEAAYAEGESKLKGNSRTVPPLAVVEMPFQIPLIQVLKLVHAVFAAVEMLVHTPEKKVVTPFQTGIPFCRPIPALCRCFPAVCPADKSRSATASAAG